MTKLELNCGPSIYLARRPDRLGAKAAGRTYSIFTLTSPYASYLELLKIFLKYMESISHCSSYSLLPINHSKVGTSKLHRVCRASHQHSEGRLQGKKCTHIVRLVVHAIYLHIFLLLVLIHKLTMEKN